MSDVRSTAFRRIRKLAGGIAAGTSAAVKVEAAEIEALAAEYAGSRESVEEKGRRLLIEGRLVVKTVVAEAPAPIYAECRGDSGETYRLGYDRIAEEWRCTCDGRGRCSHLVALQLVTVKPT